MVSKLLGPGVPHMRDPLLRLLQHTASLTHCPIHRLPRKCDKTFQRGHDNDICDPASVFPCTRCRSIDKSRYKWAINGKHHVVSATQANRMYNVFFDTLLIPNENWRLPGRRSPVRQMTHLRIACGFLLASGCRSAAPHTYSGILRSREQGSGYQRK